MFLAPPAESLNLSKSRSVLHTAIEADKAASDPFYLSTMLDMGADGELRLYIHKDVRRFRNPRIGLLSGASRPVASMGTSRAFRYTAFAAKLATRAAFLKSNSHFEKPDIY